MAYEIDPYAVLEQFLPRRQVSTIRMLLSGDSPLNPGQKVQLGEAMSALGKDSKSTGLSDVVATKGEKRVAKGTVVIDGVRFFVEPRYEKPALAIKVAEKLLDPKKYPQAWRTSRGGGQVKAEVIGPLDGEEASRPG